VLINKMHYTCNVESERASASGTEDQYICIGK